jgi:hypothetical protein
MLTKFGSTRISFRSYIVYNIFLNDIGFLDLESMLALFADDTVISFAPADLKVLTDTLTRGLIKLEKWPSHNRLILNAKKTNGMFISNGKRSKPSFNSIVVNLSIYTSTICSNFSLSRRN